MYTHRYQRTRTLLLVYAVATGIDNSDKRITVATFDYSAIYVHFVHLFIFQSILVAILYVHHLRAVHQEGGGGLKLVHMRESTA